MCKLSYISWYKRRHFGVCLSNYDKINIRKKSQKIDRVIVEEMYFHKKMKQSEITKELGVSKSTISMIISDMKNKKI